MKKGILKKQLPNFQQKSKRNNMKPILEPNPIIRQLRQEIQEEEYGFNISIVDYAEVVENDMRLDAEYYIGNIKNKNIQFIKLKEIANIFGGKRLPIGENFTDIGVPYIRAEDIKGFVDYENSPKISYELQKKLSRYQTKLNDVLLTIVGNSIGDVGIVKFNIDKCNLTENGAKINNLKNCLPEFLFIFLKSKYGQSQIKKESVGTAQPKLALCRIGEMQIPILSNAFQERIEKMVKEAHFLLEESKKAYKKAEEMLLMEVLGEWGDEEYDFFWIEDLEETERCERLDAEYFHPKYKELLEKIKSYKHGFCTLGEVCEIKDTNFNPKEEELYNYIELSSIDLQGGINEIIKDLGKNLPTRARRKVAKGDVIISSIEGSLDKVSLIDTEENNLLCSTGFYCINSKNIISEVLFLLAKSSILNIQFKRGCGGAILSSFSKQDLANATLPNLQKQFQEEVAGLVKTSFENRKRSRELLEVAKKSVELAIEEGEEKAIQKLEINANNRDSSVDAKAPAKPKKIEEKKEIKNVVTRDSKKNFK